MANKVLVLDAGSQFTKLIDRQIQKLGISCDFKQLDTPYQELVNYKGIIISGGPNSVYEQGAIMCDPRLFTESNIPILGICYGMQLINYMTGGTVVKHDIREDGQDIINVVSESKIFNLLSEKEIVLLTHGDCVDNIGTDFKVTAYSSKGIIAAIEHKNKNIFGVQFHPEVDLTINGDKIFQSFLIDVCKITPNIESSCDKLNKLLLEIQNEVKNRKVLVLISGGVDSTVCCALLYKALGKEKVIGLHIDTGFMRKNESKLVEESLKNVGIDLTIVNAEDFFLNATTIIGNEITTKLCNTVNPEIKRKIIGDTFMVIVDVEIKKLQENGVLGNFDEFMLAQGTLRPDLIESASSVVSRNAQTIKTHHNDTELVRKKRELGLIIEPLKNLHKDQVREFGLALNLPRNLIFRKPFPGPGLAIRILCQDNINNSSYNEQNVSEILKELHNNFNHDDIKFCVIPVKTVGIQGDCRTYANVVGLYLTNKGSKPNWQKLILLAKEIPKIIHNVNRVVYIFNENFEDITKVNLVPTFLGSDNLNILREIDDYVMQQLNDQYEKISQIPVVMLPINFNDVNDNKRSIVLRPFVTNNFMTGLPMIPNSDFPDEIFNEISNHVTNTFPISRVMYDLTGKPPGTTEWE